MTCSIRIFFKTTFDNFKDFFAFKSKIGVIALFVALLSIADNKGFLYVIDGYFLSLSYKISDYSIEYIEPKKVLADGNSLVLLISEEMYQGDFSGTSPLERGIFAGVIQKISNKTPKSLNIDLELSHFQKPTESNQNLFDVLIESSKQHPVNIVATSLELTPENRGYRYDWINNLCQQKNISISFSTLIESKTILSDDSSVTRFYPQLPTLGLDKSNKALDICSTRRLKDLKNLPIKNAIEKLLGRPNIDVFDKEKINYTGGSAIEIVNLSNSNAIDLLPELSNVDVFLGSNYTSSINARNDSRMTPVGTVPGVVIHAFNAYTEQHPIAAVNGVVELLFDLFVSIFIASLIGTIIAKDRSFNIKEKNWRNVSAIFAAFGLFGMLLLLFPLVLRIGYWVPPFLAIIGGISVISEAFIARKLTDNSNFNYVITWCAYVALYIALLTEFDAGSERMLASIVVLSLTLFATITIKSQCKTKLDVKRPITNIILAFLIAQAVLVYLDW